MQLLVINFLENCISRTGKHLLKYMDHVHQEHKGQIWLECSFHTAYLKLSLLTRTAHPVNCL